MMGKVRRYSSTGVSRMEPSMRAVVRVVAPVLPVCLEISLVLDHH